MSGLASVNSPMKIMHKGGKSQKKYGKSSKKQKHQRGGKTKKVQRKHKK
jgi:hypothetical protein